MTNFLMGKGYWEYVEGEHEEAPELPEDNPFAEQTKAMKDWNQGSRKVMYWLYISVYRHYDWTHTGCRLPYNSVEEPGQDV